MSSCVLNLFVFTGFFLIFEEFNSFFIAQISLCECVCTINDEIIVFSSPIFLLHRCYCYCCNIACAQIISFCQQRETTNETRIARKTRSWQATTSSSSSSKIEEIKKLQSLLHKLKKCEELSSFYSSFFFHFMRFYYYLISKLKQSDLALEHRRRLKRVLQLLLLLMMIIQQLLFSFLLSRYAVCLWRCRATNYRCKICARTHSIYT